MPFDEKSWTLPKAEGLYHPGLEKDACGVGFIVNIDGKRTHKVKQFLCNFLVFGKNAFFTAKRRDSFGLTNFLKTFSKVEFHGNFNGNSIITI